MPVPHAPGELVPRMERVERRRSYGLAGLRMSASTPRAGAMLETATEVRTCGPECQHWRHAGHSAPYRKLSRSRDAARHSD